MVLGLGSLFNHSTEYQNVGWIRDTTAGCIIYKASRDISTGEELCINYGRLWFADADAKRQSAKADEFELDDLLYKIEIDA